LGMCPAEHMSHNADQCRQPTAYSRKSGRYGLTFKSFFLWPSIVDRSTPISDDHFRVDSNGER